MAKVMRDLFEEMLYLKWPEAFFVAADILFFAFITRRRPLAV